MELRIREISLLIQEIDSPEPEIVRKVPEKHEKRPFWAFFATVFPFLINTLCENSSRATIFATHEIFLLHSRLHFTLHVLPSMRGQQGM